MNAARHFLLHLLCFGATWGLMIGVGPESGLLAAGAPNEAQFQKEIRPLFSEYCLRCHSTEKHKCDMDLERFGSLAEGKKHPNACQMVPEHLGTNEMPPKEKPQPSPKQRAQLLAWSHSVVGGLALAQAD